MVDINTQLPLALRQNKPKKKTTQLPTQIKETDCLLLVALVLTQTMGRSLSCSAFPGYEIANKRPQRKSHPRLTNWFLNPKNRQLETSPQSNRQDDLHFWRNSDSSGIRQCLAIQSSLLAVSCPSRVQLQNAKGEKRGKNLVGNNKIAQFRLPVVKKEVLRIGVLLDWWLVRKVCFLEGENFE